MKYLFRKTESGKLNETARILLFLCGLLSSFAQAETVHEVLFGKFTLHMKDYTGTIYDDTAKALTKACFEGTLFRQSTEQTTEHYVVSVEKSQIDVASEKIGKLPLTAIPPFRMKITLNKENEELLFRMIGEEDPNAMTKDMQYRVAFLVFEMAMLDVISEQYQLAEDGSIQLETSVFNYYDKGDGRRSIRKALTGGIKRTTFKVVPIVRNDTQSEYFYSNIEATEFGMEFQTKRWDIKSGRIIHAVNFRSGFKEKMLKKNIREILEVINQPERFEYYSLHELTIE